MQHFTKEQLSTLWGLYRAYDVENFRSAWVDVFQDVSDELKRLWEMEEPRKE